ncbi:MAG: hypothetical protein ACLU9S_13460 [Oscillospiraceae bacterium]
MMEDAALADAYASIHQVSPAAEKRMLQKQDAVIASIEDCVLEGEELAVRYQFTYLTNAFSIDTEFRIWRRLPPWMASRACSWPLCISLLRLAHLTSVP